MLPVGAAEPLSLVQYARGLAALGQGRQADVWAHLHRIYGPSDPAHNHRNMCGAIADLAEAAVHTGHRDGLGRPRLPRTARRRRNQPRPHHRDHRPAHPPGTPDHPARRRGHVQPRDRTAPLPLPPHHRIPADPGGGQAPPKRSSRGSATAVTGWRGRLVPRAGPWLRPRRSAGHERTPGLFPAGWPMGRSARRWAICAARLARIRPPWPQPFRSCRGTRLATGGHQIGANNKRPWAGTS